MAGQMSISFTIMISDGYLWVHNCVFLAICMAGTLFAYECLIYITLSTKRDYMNLKIVLSCCCILSLIIIAGFAGSSHSTLITVTKQHQEVYSISRYGISDTEERIGSGNSSISADSRIDMKDRDNHPIWTSGGASQTATTNYSGDSNFNIKLESEISRSFGSYGLGLYTKDSFKYLLDFNINSMAKLFVSDFMFNGPWYYINYNFYLFNKSTQNYIFNYPYIPMADIYQSSYSLDAGEYELYLCGSAGSRSETPNNYNGKFNYQCRIEATPVPEPSTVLILGAGIVCAALLRARNRKLDVRHARKSD